MTERSSETEDIALIPYPDAARAIRVAAGTYDYKPAAWLRVMYRIRGQYHPQSICFAIRKSELRAVIEALQTAEANLNNQDESK